MENVHRMVNEEKKESKKKNQKKESLGQTSIVSHSELFISSMNEYARKKNFLSHEHTSFSLWDRRLRL